MSTGARHKGDTVAAILASPEEREKIEKGKTPKRKGYRNTGLNHMHMHMKQKNRDDKLRLGPTAFRDEEHKSDFSQTAQEKKMRDAAAKRARRAGKPVEISHEQ